nr:reverse transcriptase domain, reverse transcriptase zinc-binding domain protein [Tanacetum cinerariifolium]
MLTSLDMLSHLATETYDDFTLLWEGILKLMTGRYVLPRKGNSFISKVGNVVINKASYPVQVQKVGSWNILINDDIEFTDYEDGHFDEMSLFQEPISGIIPNVTEPEISPIEEGTSDCSVPPGIIPNVTEPEISPTEEGTSDCSVPPGFKNVTKASQSFHVPKSRGALGYDVRGCKSSLRRLINDHHGKVILFGDLNEVGNISECYGSLFSSGDALIFNSFIQDVNLFDLLIGESVISLEDIRFTVWDCGSQKAPGTDRFTFKFMKYFWDYIKLDIQSFVVKFFESSKLPQGSNMNCVASWKVLIDRFKNKLSGWKASLLYIGGRLTLIKSVLGSLGIYYMSIFKAPGIVFKILESFRASFFWGSIEDKKKLAWIKWSNILASFDKGGLGVGGIKGFNISLIYKWRWRMMKNPEALWVKVIKSIHGAEAGMDSNGCQTNGLWAKIVGTINYLHSSDLVQFSSIKYKVGDDSLIRFWIDTWVGDSPLRDRFNRLFHLENSKECLIQDRFSNGSWSWDWIRPISSGRSYTDYICRMLLVRLSSAKIAILVLGLFQTMVPFLLAAFVTILTTACSHLWPRAPDGAKYFQGKSTFFCGVYP